MNMSMGWLSCRRATHPFLRLAARVETGLLAELPIQGRPGAGDLWGKFRDESRGGPALSIIARM